MSLLALNRLGQRDGAALVEGLAGDAGLPREIIERTDGVPRAAQSRRYRLKLPDRDLFQWAEAANEEIPNKPGQR